MSRSPDADADARSSVEAAPPNAASRRRAHATLAMGLTLCVAAFWFELSRALGGNGLSWAYVFEWPLLGTFSVYMWWKVIHPEPPSGGRAAKEPSLAPEFSGMLSAWQEHQRELAKSREAPSENRPRQ